jgi:hypothetical protein
VNVSLKWGLTAGKIWRTRTALVPFATYEAGKDDNLAPSLTSESQEVPASSEVTHSTGNGILREKCI